MSKDGRLRDYCDGKQFKDHPIFSSEPNALQIQLYYDDIDVCNPIGSKSVIHKLGMLNLPHSSVNFFCIIGLFYYTLGNIDPMLRSKLRTIMLVAVVKTSSIEKYGIDVVLEPFVEDMKHLESVSTCLIRLYNACIYSTV